MTTYSDYVVQLTQCLDELVVSDKEGQFMNNEEGLHRWCSMTDHLQKINNTMYFVGNGASAMMASHMAADASKNGGFRAMAFNDQALMTAVSNDINYEQSFAVPLKRFANSGDVLVTISSSGNSPNVIAAIEAAMELKMQVITLSGMKQDNKSRQIGDLNFYVPAETYGLAECSHQSILHCWLDTFMENKEGTCHLK